MRKTLEQIGLILALVAVTAVAGAGCHRDRGVKELDQDQKKAFNDAPVELKQNWEKALAADNANDYVTAASLLDELDKATLSDPQRQALNTERGAFADRLMRAADNNNAAAIQALKNSARIQHR